MKILVACEESQAVTVAFRKRGHEAYSCDIQDCSGGHPEWHIKGDITEVLRKTHKWDMILLFPPCTYMAVSGNRWYAGTEQRKKAVRWTYHLWFLAKQKSKKVALENPVSVIWNYIDRTQYIQPWQFGHGETKKTGLALHNLPKLEPTDIVDGREQRIWKMAPSPERSKLRSKTFSGIAEAIADQWG